MLLCVLAWIGFNIYHSAVTPTIPEEQINQVAPINPDFDTKTILKLKGRNYVVPIYQNNSTTSVNIKPTPTLTTQLSSKSATTTIGGKLK